MTFFHWLGRKNRAAVKEDHDSTVDFLKALQSGNATIPQSNSGHGQSGTETVAPRNPRATPKSYGPENHPLLDREPVDILRLDLVEQTETGDVWKVPTWQTFLMLANSALSSREVSKAQEASKLLDSIEGTLESHSTVQIWRGLLARASNQPETSARVLWANSLNICRKKCGLSKEIGLSYLEESDCIRGTAWLLLSALTALKDPSLSQDDSEGWVYLASIAELLELRRLAIGLFRETDLRKKVRLNFDEVCRIRRAINSLTDEQRQQMKDLLHSFCARTNFPSQ